jgi:hypothetical protein
MKIIILLATLIIALAQGAPHTGQNSLANAKSSLERLELVLRGINTLIITVNSYLAAAGSILREYKIVESFEVLESILAFLFNIQNILTILFTLTFFTFMIENAPGEEQLQPVSTEEEEMALRQ